jgi:hypothetical protein
MRPKINGKIQRCGCAGEKRLKAQGGLRLEVRRVEDWKVRR